MQKTKAMLVDFKRQFVFNQLSIDVVAIVRVDGYKDLRTVLNQDLIFNDNTDAIFKMCLKRLFVLRKLRNMDMNSDP